MSTQHRINVELLAHIIEFFPKFRVRLDFVLISLGELR